MADSRGISRGQTAQLESITNTRQDRNLRLTEGGLITWDAVGGTLTWAGTFRVQIPGLGTHTITSSNLAALSAGGDCAVVTLNRGTGAALTMSKSTVATTSLLTDTTFLIGIRGTDGRFYMADGTVFSDGETKLLGTTQAVLDRTTSVSDGRAYTVNYPTGKQTDNDTDGVTNGTTTFTSTNATFDTSIPNTANVPDTPSYIRINTKGLYRVVTVSNDTTLILDGTPSADTGLTYEVYTNVIGYVVGSDQLQVFVNGLLAILWDGTSGNYDEVGGAGSTSYQIAFRSGSAPSAAQLVTFLNVVGGQGPAGVEVAATLTNAYDEGPTIDGDSGTPVTLDFPNGSDVALQTKVAGGSAVAKLEAGGTATVTKVRIPDGGDFWDFYVNSGVLEIKHSGTGKGFQIQDTGRISVIDGSAAWLRWALYSGTFTATPIAVTLATGITSGVYGAIFMLEDQVIGSKFVMGEFNGPSIANQKAIISYNQSTGDIFIAGDFAGVANPGVNYASGDWKLILFYV